MDLLIVESGAKSKTIQKYLGKGWIVAACNGHVQDLPTSRETKDGKKAMWACKPDTLPNPPWEWTENSERTIGRLITKAKEKNVSNIYIATDPDREGEFIAWRLEEIFREQGFNSINRVTFNEITKSAVQAAIDAGGSVNPRLVSAAKVRRFMDRLVGFRASKFSRSWSLPAMGRVQTPTMGFVVERELEREAFVPLPYYAVYAEAGGIRWNAKFHDKGDSDAWIDDKGKFHSERTNDNTLAQSAYDALNKAAAVTLDSVEPGTYQRNPDPPFTTDTMLMKVGSEIGWNPRRTMRIAGELYNAGHITYIRTDSTRTSAGAREEIKNHIKENWGEDYLGKGVVGPDAKSDSTNVQDAHEAIRPTQVVINNPDGLSSDQSRLYRMIWARFTGSQMSSSRYERLSMTAVADGFTRNFSGTASWRVHAGWEAAFEGIRKEPATSPPSFDTTVGSTVSLDPSDDEDSPNPCLKEDETQPPSRYKQHSLVKMMKSEGIGRPSTYATTIEKLLRRKYMLEENGSLVPTDEGRTLWQEIVPYYSRDESGGNGNLFSTEFTSEMEESLDAIEREESEAAFVWNHFSEHFQSLHQIALDKKKLKPTPKQSAYFDRITEGMSDKEIAAYTGGRGKDEMTGDEMRLILENLTKDRPQDTLPASKKQVDWIASLAEMCNLSEADACAHVELKSFSELTGGRSGSASQLIEVLRELSKDVPRPASPKQLNWITKMADKAGLTMTEACQLIGVNDSSELTGAQNGTASQLISILLEKTGGNKKRRGKKSGDSKSE
ncbi:MAG: type IA DNA topoisomerase [Candidatus Thermoplasmatota archaeon]|nr:type IA DNA topoisomerase [Candidatus Thermoplasmatota archaeon]